MNSIGRVSALPDAGTVIGNVAPSASFIDFQKCFTQDIHEQERNLTKSIAPWLYNFGAGEFGSTLGFVLCLQFVLRSIRTIVLHMYNYWVCHPNAPSSLCLLTTLLSL